MLAGVVSSPARINAVPQHSTIKIQITIGDRRRAESGLTDVAAVTPVDLVQPRDASSEIAIVVTDKAITSF
jgi:hypothetical protein